MPDHAGWLRDAIAELERTLAGSDVDALQRQHAERLLYELQAELDTTRSLPACCASMLRAPYFACYDHS